MTADWRRARDTFEHETAPSLIRDLYHGDPASLQFISADYNIVYRFEACGRGFYLRICHTALHPLPKARQVMGFLRFLADDGVPVGAPVASVHGEFIEALPGGYFASAQIEAPGQLMTRHMLDCKVYRAWGRSLACCTPPHAAFNPIPPSTMTSRPCKDSGATSSLPFAAFRRSCKGYMPS